GLEVREAVQIGVVVHVHQVGAVLVRYSDENLCRQSAADIGLTQSLLKIGVRRAASEKVVECLIDEPGGSAPRQVEILIAAHECQNDIRARCTAAEEIDPSLRLRGRGRATEEVLIKSLEIANAYRSRRMLRR